jgi:hypothetical protein
VPGFKVALDKLVGKQKMPRQAVVLGAGGGAGRSSTASSPRASSGSSSSTATSTAPRALVKHFGRSASHMELRAMPWHESIIESELAKARSSSTRRRSG